MVDMLTEEKLLSGLNSQDPSLLHVCFINLREKYVVNIPKMRTLSLEHGVIEKVITHMEHPKLCNIALSIIANICMDDFLREEVIKYEGVVPLARVMNGLANHDILNRACRALGNVAISVLGLSHVHDAKAVSGIVEFLNSAKLPEFQMTAIRTLRIIGRDKKTLTSLIRENAIFAISKCVCCDSSSKLVISAVKALALLTRNSKAEVAQQIRSAGIIGHLVQLYTESNDPNLKVNALTCLLNLARISAIREDLGEAGAFKVFIDLANSVEYSEKAQSAVLALCHCCSEYWERRKIRDNGGLYTFVKVLKTSQYEQIHRHVIITLTHLCSEIEDLDALQKSNIYGVLLDKLKLFTERNSRHHPQSISEEKKEPLPEKLICAASEDAIEGHKASATKSGKRKRTNSVSSKNNLRSSNDTVYSIHSPTYQGMQYSDSFHASANFSSYASFSSPKTQINVNSPECYSFDWNPSSPVSCSSTLSPWSPCSSSNDNRSMCWSPVLSSHSHTPDSNEPDDLDHFDDCGENEAAVLPSIPVESKLIATNFDSTDDTQSKSSAPKLLCQSNLEKQLLISKELGVDKAVEQKCFHSSPDEELKNEKSRNPSSTVNEKFSEDTSFGCSSVNIPSTSSLAKISRKRKLSESDCSESSISALMNNIPLLCEEIKISLSPKRTAMHSGKPLDHYILLLLSHLTHQLMKTSYWNSLEEFALDVFLKYLSAVSDSNMRAVRILINIIANPSSFQQLVTYNFVYKLEKALISHHDFKTCSHCSNVENIKKELIFALKTMATSNFGSSTIGCILQSKNVSHKVYCLYAIIKLLVDNIVLLCKFLVSANGLDVFSVLKAEDNPILFEFASATLSHIWRALCFTPTKRNMQMSACDLYCKYNYMKNRREFDLKLIADDDSVAFALRGQLCEKSAYFHALLAGNFIEANQNAIKIPAISGQVLLHVVHFLHGCLPGWCPSLSSVESSDLHDLLKASDLFILETLKRAVQELMLTRFEMKIAFEIYQTFKTYGTSDAVKSLLHLILSNENQNEKYFVACMRNLFNFDADYIVHLIKDEIECRLREML